jgi:HD domain
MSDPKARREIALAAARLMYVGTEKEYFTAKRKVARRRRRRGTRARRRGGADLPSNRQIRDALLEVADLHEGEDRLDRLGHMRQRALELLEVLAPFHPRLMGSVCTGHIRRGSDIDVHVFSDSVAAVSLRLQAEQLDAEVERKRVVKHGVAREFVHLHLALAEYDAELTVYPLALRRYPFRSSITGDTMESVDAVGLGELLAREHPGLDRDEHSQPFASDAERALRRAQLRALLAALEGIDGGRHHPEGDQLYHSLQVFELARERRPWDVEFAEAALLHDVGKAIDRRDHAAAGAEALEGLVSERVLWLVAHHMDALALRQGALGRRQSARLRASPWFDDLLELRECDEGGRVPGVAVGDLDEALHDLEQDPQELSGEIEEQPLSWGREPGTGDI